MSERENIVSTPPLTSAIVNNDGKLTRAWAIWFRDIFDRVANKRGNAIDENEEETFSLSLSHKSKSENDSECDFFNSKQRNQSYEELLLICNETKKTVRKLEQSIIEMQGQRKRNRLFQEPSFNNGSRADDSIGLISQQNKSKYKLIFAKTIKTESITINDKKIYVAGNSVTFNSDSTVFDNLVKAPVLATSTYEVASLPDAVFNKDGVITVYDEVGGYTLAFSDGTNWRRATDLSIVS